MKKKGIAFKATTEANKNFRMKIWFYSLESSKASSTKIPYKNGEQSKDLDVFST